MRRRLLPLAAGAVAVVLSASAAAAADTAPGVRGFAGVSPRLAVWIAAQLHLMFGAFVLGVPIFVSTVEIIGWRRADDRYEALARELTGLLSTAFSVAAALGALLVFTLVALYPRLMEHLAAVFAPTYALYALLILAETLTLYLYAYAWEAMRGRWKAAHVGLGVLLNVLGTVLLLVANAWTSYMMSPAGVDVATGRPTGAAWYAVANPLWIPLSIHRVVANVTFGGFVVAAYAAVKFLAARTAEARAHYDWMGWVGNLVGLAGMILLPFAGYYLGREVYSASPVMGNNMMGGAFSWTFILQAALIGLLFVGANYYLWTGLERLPGAETPHVAIRWVDAALVAAFAVWLTPRNLPLTAEEQLALGGQFHPVLRYFGLMPAKNAAVNVIILATLWSLLLYRRGSRGRPRRFADQPRATKLALAATGVAAALLLGWYARALLVLDPRRIDLAPEQGRYALLPAALLVGQIALVAVTAVLVVRDRPTLAQAIATAGTAAGAVGVLGTWGFVVMERANPLLRQVAVAQWLLVMVCLGWVFAIDVVAARGAAAGPAVRWGRVPARSQYALILCCVSVVLLMGLMGFVRSGLREDWHVYGVVRDATAEAWTPSNAYMARVVGAITLVFLALITVIFWLPGLRRSERARGEP